METRRQREQLMQQIFEEHQRQVEEETWSLHPLEYIDERYVVKSGKNDGNWLMEKFLDDCDQVWIDCDLRNKSIEQTRLKLLEMKLQVLREEIEEKRENQRLMRLFDEEQRRKRESMRLQLERDYNREKDSVLVECTEREHDNDKKGNNDNANADDNDVDNDEMKNNQTNLKDDDGEDDESANDELMDDRQENCHEFDDDGEAKNGQSDLDSDNIVLCNDNDVNNENYKERKNDFDSNNKTALRNSDYTINGKGDNDKKWKIDQKGGYETSITYLGRINPELKTLEPLMSKKKKKRWKMEKGHVCRDGDRKNDTHCSLSL